MIVPGSAAALLLAANQGYQIPNSLRFRSSASARLSRTNAATGNSDAWTWSAWVKRGQLNSAASFVLFSATIVAGTSEENFTFTNDALRWGDGASGENYVTTALFRDPSAWYHIVLVYDSNNATAGDRLKIYVNGVRQTTTGTTMASSRNSYFATNANTITIGRFAAINSTFFDGYIGEINFVDALSLDATYFGKADLVTGAWVPKRYSGSYGTNGFYLPFNDGTSTTTLGYDRSGNSNNWTLNNISLTSGATYDWMADTPTNNYCTLSPLSGANLTLTNGNLTYTTTVAPNTNAYGTFFVSSGKWYWETVASSNGNVNFVGVAKANATDYVAYYGSNGNRYIPAGNAAFGATYTNGDVIGMALDMAALTITFYKNNVSQGSVSIAAGEWTPYIGDGSSTVSQVGDINFGQRPFTYTAPTGFQALCSQNLPAPVIKKPSQYFSVLTWTGNGSTPRAFSGVGFAPDFVWTKQRSSTANHALIDSVRGTGSKILASNLTSAEVGDGASVTSFDSDGFTVAQGSVNFSYYNTNAATYVGWCFKKGVVPGFDIVTYTGNGANRTIAHSLGVAPKLMIVKSRASANSWVVWHTTLAGTEYLNLDGTGARATLTTEWNSTVPTSSVFSVGTAAETNTNANSYIAYLFAEVEGFSKFSSYTGNGSADGPFVYCGFRPRWLLVKRIDSAGNWVILDTSRDPTNEAANSLYPSLTTAEGSGVRFHDILSNGFKIRSTGAAIADHNASGGTYIFAAFAETPFKYANAR